MSSDNDKPITITSFFTAVFNLMNAILGAGIVGLPYAASNLGYNRVFQQMTISGDLTI